MQLLFENGILHYGYYEAIWSVRTVHCYMMLKGEKKFEFRAWRSRSKILERGAWVLLQACVFLENRDLKEAKSELLKSTLVTVNLSPFLHFTQNH